MHHKYIYMYRHEGSKYKLRGVEPCLQMKKRGRLNKSDRLSSDVFVVVFP